MNQEILICKIINLKRIMYLTFSSSSRPANFPASSPAEDHTLSQESDEGYHDEYRPLTFHGLLLRDNLVTLLKHKACYPENVPVSHLCLFVLFLCVFFTNMCRCAGWQSCFWTTANKIAFVTVYHLSLFLYSFITACVMFVYLKCVIILYCVLHSWSNKLQWW